MSIAADPFAPIKAARREGRWLRFSIDGWSLAYLAAATALFVIHWHLPTIQPLLVVIACAMAYGAGCIQHDHAHLPLWRSPTLNLLTSCWIALLRGDGPWSWLPTHVGNHHRYANQRGDWTLTWRTGEGMHLGNWALYTLIGLVLYVVGALRYLGRSLVRRPAHGLACLLQLAVVVALITVAWWSDPLRAWWLIAVPWSFGLVAMVATGYLQHHHTDADSPWRHSRDFTGRLNNLLHFNHGYHGVHHVDPTLHWSEWPAAHALVADQRDPALEESSLPRFLLRTFLAAPFVALLRRVRPVLRSPS